MESSSPSLLFGRDDAVIFRYPSDPPYTTTSLTANLILRVLLALVGNMVCLVPLRLLHRNGEFAAVVFIINVMAINLETVVMALIWRDDDLQSWWPGYGLCDVDPFFHNASQALYVTCLLAIMRNLSHQVGILRANPLTVKERRRRNLIQALIMFPLPALQMAMTWPITTQRYAVGVLIGCAWVPHASWPNLAFFILPPIVVAFITSAYAVQVYFRFRQVAKSTRTALSSNRTASRRSQRTRRRLYLMVTSIIVPFFPVVVALAVVNVLANLPLLPFDYNDIHNHELPAPWNTIAFIPSSMINWAYMNNCYISILSVVPIFVFFGLTKDALNQYRQGCLLVGLGRVFPRLNEEYDPDRRPSGGSSYGSSQANTMPTTQIPGPGLKLDSSMSSRQFSRASSPSAGCRRDVPTRTINLGADLDIESCLSHDIHQPELPSQRSCPENTAANACRRNPFPFSTRLNFTLPLKLPFSKFKVGKQVETPPDLPLGPCPPTTLSYGSSRDTRSIQNFDVADEEARLFDMCRDTGDIGSFSFSTVKAEKASTGETSRENLQR